MNNNQKRKFSIVNYLFSILLLLAAMLLAGCSKDTPVDNPDDPSNPVNVVMQNVALTGLVKDASGIPLSGVKVTTGSLNATTGKDGTFSFTQAGTVDSVAVVKFEKSGYFTLTRSGDQADAMYIEAMMYPTGNSDISLQTNFESSTAQKLQISGISIDLPASCFTSANGSAYSGTVKADVLYLSPTGKNTAAMMPGGDLTGIRSDKSKGMILPIGMMDVVFTDKAGNLLKIKDKTDIKISFPVPAEAVVANLPATVSLWSFDEAKGVWVEEGTVTLQGNSYTGTVSHFTNYAVGKLERYKFIEVHVTECDNPAKGAVINTYDAMTWGFDISVATGTTGSKGICTFMTVIPEGSENGCLTVLQTSYNGKVKVTNVVLTTNSDLTTFVEVKFDDKCSGGDLTFNLKAGPTRNSVIIECSPPMPLTHVDSIMGLSRSDPAFFLTGLGTSGVLGIYWNVTASSGAPGGIITRGSKGEGWNSDFTEYTYVFCHSFVTTTAWTEANVTIGNVNTDKINGSSSSIAAYGIKSITVGNKSASIRVEGMDGQ